MALSLSSPGITIREVDLTRGSVNPTSQLAAGIAAPFSRGPVDEVITITSERDLLDVFGPPSMTDYHYEYWYSASNFMSYGGSLRVVRADSTNLKNANAGISTTGTIDLKLKNYEDYQNSVSSGYYWAARNPGYWADGLKICVIDNFADQVVSVASTSGVSVGYGVTQTVTGGYLKGIISGIGNSEFYVKVVSKVLSGTETDQEYTERGIYEFKSSTSLTVVNNSGVGVATTTPTSISDWYNQQYILNTANGDRQTVLWKSVAPKPRTNQYVSSRNGSNDALHVVIVDNAKASPVSGTPQEILEVFRNLSKATDTVISPSEQVYYKDYISLNSRYIFAGDVLGSDAYWGITEVSSNFTSGFTTSSPSLGVWGTSSVDTDFNSVGNVSFVLSGGKDYSTAPNQETNVGGYALQLSDLSSAIDRLANRVESDIAYIIQGSASGSIEFEQARASYLIAAAEERKDCLAFISPYRAATVNVASEATKLANVLAFFTPLTSSSYAVFDSGYQYIYDRFNKQYVYIPCSADIAGVAVRTDINQYPWYSPAGKTRGTLKNVIKLSYNPDQDARDQLYSNRVNPVITYPGSGSVLFGDKTALSYTSAFDRINVRKLFIAIENAIRSAADAQLFEFNDAATRGNFINIVEPYLREVQAKRGISDFLLVCDESNNTPAVIDRNEFVADIYVKPARSINFIGLTFIATRTGVSFESVVGTF